MVATDTRPRVEVDAGEEGAARVERLDDEALPRAARAELARHEARRRRGREARDHSLEDGSLADPRRASDEQVGGGVHAHVAASPRTSRHARLPKGPSSTRCTAPWR